MSARGREFVEAALCIAAYLAYMEFCTLKGTEETRLFKGFTHRSAGPLWALLRDCLGATGTRAQICREFRELITPEFSAAVDSAVNNIDRVKHGKAILAEGDLLRPVTILANVAAKVFVQVAFGLFEQVQKKSFFPNPRRDLPACVWHTTVCRYGALRRSERFFAGTSVCRLNGKGSGNSSISLNLLGYLRTTPRA